MRIDAMNTRRAFFFGLIGALGALLLARQPSRGQGAMTYPTFG
jgi:hypothetical protein